MWQYEEMYKIPSNCHTTCLLHKMGFRSEREHNRPWEYLQKILLVILGWGLVSKGSCRNLIWRAGVSQGRDLAERGGRSHLACSAACISILSPSQKIPSVNLCNHGVGSVQSFYSNVSRSQFQCWLHLWSDMSCTMHNVACMTPDARLIKASASSEHKGSVGNNRLPLFLSQWHNSWWWPPSTSDATLCISTGEDAQSQGGAYYASVFMHMRWC